MQRDWLMDYCRGMDGLNEDNGKLLEEVQAQMLQDPELNDAIGALHCRFDTHEPFSYQLSQERKNNEGLKRLAEVKPCHIGNLSCEIPCQNEARWSFNGFPLCQDHLRQMADMNGDNYEAVKAALDNPLRVIVNLHQDIPCEACEKRATVWVVNMEGGKEVQHPRCGECKARQLEVV